jgi:hypothetical protein
MAARSPLGWGFADAAARRDLRCCTHDMIGMSSSSTWPPRRLPSRRRLFRIRMIRLRSEFLLPIARRLALWTAWLGATGFAFMMLDLYA